MAASLISNIYDDFRDTFEDNSQFLIDFFTKNTIAFNNIKTFSDEDDLHRYIELSSFYADALYGKGRYNDTIDFINKSLQIINDEITRLVSVEVKDDWYYSILLSKGMAMYNLREYKMATLIFNELVTYNPQNDRYRKWLTSSKYGQRQLLMITIYIISALFMLAGIMLDHYFKGLKYRIFFPIIGFGGFIGISIYEWHAKRSFRKSKAKR